MESQPPDEQFFSFPGTNTYFNRTDGVKNSRSHNWDLVPGKVYVIGKFWCQAKSTLVFSFFFY